MLRHMKLSLIRGGLILVARHLRELRDNFGLSADEMTHIYAALQATEMARNALQPTGSAMGHKHHRAECFVCRRPPRQQVTQDAAASDDDLIHFDSLQI